MSAGLDRPLLRGYVRELPFSPDLAGLAGVARDLGHEVILIERPMPDAVSVLGIGRLLEIVPALGGGAVRAESASGEVLGVEAGPPLAAASVLWQRLAVSLVAEGEPGLPGTGVLAMGGFAFDPTREPSPPWDGFPAVLLRVPGLIVSRVRGRTFACLLDSSLEPLLEQPAAPAYQPRSMVSSDEMSSHAGRRGWPATAGVGCSAAARRRAGAGESSNSRARTLVARCWMFVKRTTSGSAASTEDANGASASRTAVAVTRCSERFLAEARSSAASLSSSASSAPRAVEPAIGWQKAVTPVRRTSSSGVAPAKAVPSAPDTR